MQSTCRCRCYHFLKQETRYEIGRTSQGRGGRKEREKRDRGSCGKINKYELYFSRLSFFLSWVFWMSWTLNCPNGEQKSNILGVKWPKRRTKKLRVVRKLASGTENKNKRGPKDSKPLHNFKQNEEICSQSYSPVSIHARRHWVVPSFCATPRKSNWKSKRPDCCPPFPHKKQSRRCLPSGHFQKRNGSKPAAILEQDRTEAERRRKERRHKHIKKDQWLSQSVRKWKSLLRPHSSSHPFFTNMPSTQTQKTQTETKRFQTDKSTMLSWHSVRDRKQTARNDSFSKTNWLQKFFQPLK